MEDKHNEPLYSLNSFLKFERKIYQFAGIPFGRPIKAKTAIYFIAIFALLMIWRIIPIFNLPIKWIPIIILIILSGVLAWLLADIGTEARNPIKYFRSVFQYQTRKLRKITYYRGKEIKKLTDHDVSGHVLFSLPNEHIENHARIVQLERNYEFSSSFEEKVEDISIYQNTTFDFKALTARMSDFAISPIETKGEEKEVEISSVEHENIAIEEVVQLLEETVTENVAINEMIENTSISEISPITEEKNNSSIMYYPVLVNLETAINEDAFINDSSSKEELESFNEKQENETRFERIHLTPTTLNNAVESVDKLKELEEKVMYLKIGDIKKMSQSESTDVSNEEKISKIALYIERVFESIERRKQEKRFKERQKKR